ncbi:phage shock protein C (PspC) family protein [Proteiniborus ethanoligenes]|uniref:Phage shock protein C (PspC) family protein n=1 Tax=Proteiniborus ethanoligenes TaxID=415015 RepID=A0A1H3LFC9_9FIRM|nr:PspC domain-containing protein [Proteiniborus ethanoligenes]TAH64022.1 MAG: PspC domain-containing protein [Gottschalkiaceae bacterium]SDY62654.1 phage shock protein C (PspC) family protein [Proteiniborus ethanoligenes]
MDKRLYRSRDNRIISGVCGGFADYFQMDPVIVRLICVLLFFAKAIGVLAYLLCMIIIPEAPLGYRKEEHGGNINSDSTQWYTQNNQKSEKDYERNRRIFGLILIGLGVFVFARKLFVWFDYVNFGGILLVLVGLYIIFKGRGGTGNEEK